MATIQDFVHPIKQFTRTGFTELFRVALRMQPNVGQCYKVFYLNFGKCTFHFQGITRI